MKISHLLNHAQKANGHVHVAVDLACEQAAQGHEVVLMAGPNDFAEPLERHGVRYVGLPASKARDTGRRIDAVRSLPNVAVFAAKYFYQHRPDIIHSHMPRSALLAWATGGVQGVPLVSSVHNSFDRQARLMGFADRVVCVSDAVSRHMAQRGVSARKLRTVYNGTSGSARLSERPQAMAGVQTPAIACVAGLHGRKAVDDLIRAADMLMREHPKVHFYIAGSGPDAPSLKEQARATCAPERIVFVGHLPDPRALLQACDIFALASLSDPFPLVILEALEEGCAVVATDVDGIPEALDFGQSGVLVPPRAPAELYKALSRILAAPAELARLKAAALTRSKAFSVARMAAQYVDIYRELLAR
ncbi:MAG: hypothetical protein RL385_1455 [Pseudomonadota bacterium]|jgi:glycosyltransferase involved in cell wall biosynthesis